MPHKFNPLLAKLIQEVSPKSNHSAIIGPGVTDDVSKGYAIGSRWTDIVAVISYTCLDATSGSAVWYVTSSLSAGETNTASNVGTAGVGIYKQKTGVDLEFKKVNAGSSKITITDDVANDEVDIDVSTGATGNDICVGNDARLSNSRNPTAHAGTHVTGGGDTIANVIAAGNSGLMSGADKTKLNGIEDLADVTDAVNIASSIVGVNAKATPVNADTIPLIDSADGSSLKKVLWSQIKATLKTYFDTLYNKYVHPNHTGEVTSVADGAQTITAKAVTYTKIQDVSATDKILGRSSVGAGVTEEITCTSAGRSILDDVDNAAQRTTLGLVIGTDVLAQQTIGIANDNLVEIDDVGAADDEYARFTANGIEGRTVADVITDLSLGNAKIVNQMLYAESAYLPESDFSLTGTVTMTNGSTAVTGAGTAFDTELQVNDYIKLDADTSISWAKIASIETATGLTLTANYVGAGGASAGSGSGNPADLSESLGSGRYIGYALMKFDDTLANPDGGEKCGWRIPMPDYDGGNIVVTAYSKVASTPAGAVTLQYNILTIGLANSEAFDAAITVDTGINISHSLNTTELLTDIMVASATIDPANVSADDLLVIELSRDVVNDTLVGDGELVGIMLKYTRA